jgi:protein-tyrosine phosphatase
MDGLGFVDCHSHVVPSGDDGAATVAEGRALCRSAAEHGTRVLYATPHVWPDLPLTAEREARVRRTHAELAAGAPLELRLGFELTPSWALVREDLRRYALQGTTAVLMEVPFVGSADSLLALAERAERQGLRPLIAHPERSDAALERPRLAFELAERGWALQVNATSLVGYHGPSVEALGWKLVVSGAAALVASDGHRPARPPHLDAAYGLVVERVGEAWAQRLFRGEALGPELATARPPSHADRRAV